MSSHIYQVSNAEKLKQIIIFISNDTIPKPTLIHLAPGKYDVNLRLPPFLKIKGSGINLTILNLLDTFYFESNNYLEDLTLEYSYEIDNLLDTPVKELFQLNCLSYLEQLSNVDNLLYDNTVYLKNIQINLYNIRSGYVWSILHGNLKLENVDIKHKIIEDLDEFNDIDELYYEIHNLFSIGNFCQLNLHNCKIDYQCENKNTVLFCGNLSNLYLDNTHIKLYSSIQIEQSYIFYLTYTKLKIVNSKIENLCNGGNLFFTDTETELELSNLLSNFCIERGWMKIEKIREEAYLEKMLDSLEGISYQNKKYIFGNCRKNVDNLEIQVSLPNYAVPGNLELVREPKYELLFLLDISYSELFINNYCNLEDNINDYYLLKFQSVNYSNLIQKKQINLTGGKKWNYNFKKGELEIDSINTNILSKISLHHVCRQDQGYSMLSKEKVGTESIDFTTGDSFVEGAFNFASGSNNLVEGNYSTLLGNNNKVFSSNSLTIGNNLVNKFNNCILLGRYNIPEYDWKQKLLVVGNGNNEKNSDALVVYESGEVKIYNSFCSPKISDGIIQIEEGNIKDVKNIEVEENIYINQDIIVEGEIKGATVLENTIPMDIIQISGERLTTWKIDLSKFTSPSQYGGVFNLLESKFNYLARLDEKTHGIVYQMEVICLETPNRTDVRFILTNSKTWKCSTHNNVNNVIKVNLGSKDEDEDDNKVIDVISSYEWKKGKRIVEVNKFRDEYNYNIVPYYFYLAREVPHKYYQDLGEKRLTGKFLVKIKGVELF